MKSVSRLILSLSLFALLAPADQVTLEPVADSTIYASGDYSNGTGQQLFTNAGNQSENRRSLIKFDFTGSIPAGATINSASLTLTRIGGKGSGLVNHLHRLTRTWVEAQTDGNGIGGGQGQGSDALNGDPTWDTSSLGGGISTDWTTPGGDFITPSSASQTVGAANGPYVFSSAGLASDVQGWLDATTDNDGWILIGDELAAQTSFQFGSREQSTPANRPQLLVDFTPAAAPGPAVPSIVTSNLVVSYASDFVDNNSWPNLTAASTIGGLDRIMTNRTASAAAPLLVTEDLRTLLRIDSYYRFNTNSSPVGLLGSTTISDTYGEAEQFNGFSTRNVSLEIWFRPADANGGAQILWESGGGTGSSFTLLNSNLVFNTRSQNTRYAVTNDISVEIATGDFIQAFGTIELNDGAERIELFVNGASIGSQTNGAINSWNGGDGDGLGGRGQNNLGGRGNGFNYDGTSYNSFNGDIAIFRIYGETNAAAQTGSIVRAADVLQNYRAIATTTIVYDDEGINNSWTNGPNWGVLGNSAADLVPVAGENVYVGNGANNQAAQGPVIDTPVAGPHNLILGHNLGSFDGFGNLTLDPGAALVVSNDFYLGSDNSQGDVYHNGGTNVVGGDMIYGRAPSTVGGEYRLRGGRLEVMGDLVERVTAVNTAQMYVDGGELLVHGTNIVAQSFRVGHEGGRIGEFTVNPGQRLRNTGTFFIGNNGKGTLNIHGEVISGSSRIVEQAGGAGSVVNVGTPTLPGRWNLTGGQLDIGRRGDGRVNLTNGLVNASNTVRFGLNNTNPGPQLNVHGGVFAANNSIQDPNGIGQINLINGELDLSQVNNNNRAIGQLNMNTGGVLRVGLFNSTTGLNPLDVVDTASFITGSQVAVEDQRSLTGGGGTPVTWIGADSIWDTQDIKWEDDAGINLLPSQGLDALIAGSEFVIINATSLVDASLLSSATPGWSVTSTPTSVSVVRDSTLGGGPVLATVTNLGSVVRRSDDLLIAASLGADAAGLQIDTGSLLVSNLLNTVDLTLGGSNGTGTVTQNDGDVLVTGDLLFGQPGTTQGGVYNLNGGSLTVGGQILETDAALVANAQMHLNGGTLNVSSPIAVQRFSVGENGSAAAVYTSTVPITTSGSFIVGGIDSAIGEFIMDDATDSVSAFNATLGQNDQAIGTLRMENGFFEVTAGKLSIGGDNNADTNVVGTVILGLPGSSNNPLIEVTGGNTELGQGNIGNLTMHSGTLRQISNNLVLGQGPNGQAFLTVNGGTLAINGGANDNRNINVNNGSAVIEINGGEVLIGQHLNLGSATASSSVLTMTNGLLSIGGNLDFRNNGNDAINFSGGDIIFTRSRTTGIVHMGNRTGTNSFTWTGGTLQNVGTWNGDLEQQGGVLDIGASIGSMTITGGYTSAPPASLAIELTTTNSDQLVVQGNLDLNGMSLDLSLLDPAVTNQPNGTRFVIIDGSAAPVGQFVQGTNIVVDGAEFTIHYGGASGDDVEIIVGTEIDITQDTDMDGIPDVLELAFGTDPNSGTSGEEGLPYIERFGTDSKLFFRKLIDPGTMTYFIESSVELEAGFTLENVTPTPATDQSGLPAGVELMEVTFPTTPDAYKTFRVGVNL